MDAKTPSYRSSVSSTKRSAVLDAARTLFLKSGYSATGMTEIANLADVSTATLYKYFRSKDILFDEIIDRSTENLDMDLGKLTIDPTLIDNAYKTANRLLKSFIESDLPQLMRVVIAEAYLSPELARKIFNRLTQKWYGPSQKIMDELIRVGIAKPHDTAQSARFLIGMIKETFIWPSLFGMEADTSRETRHSAMREIVAVFMTYYGTESFKSNPVTREWIKPLPGTRND